MFLTKFIVDCVFLLFQCVNVHIFLYKWNFLNSKVHTQIVMTQYLFSQNVPNKWEHSHKKHKDSLDGSLDRVSFVAKLGFPKILVARLFLNTPKVNTECTGKSKQLYSL